MRFKAPAFPSSQSCLYTTFLIHSNTEKMSHYLHSNYFPICKLYSTHCLHCGFPCHFNIPVSLFLIHGASLSYKNAFKNNPFRCRGNLFRHCSSPHLLIVINPNLVLAITAASSSTCACLAI